MKVVVDDTPTSRSAWRWPATASQMGRRWTPSTDPPSTEPPSSVRIPTGTFPNHFPHLLHRGLWPLKNGSDSFLLASDEGDNGTLTFEDGLELYGKTWDNIEKISPVAEVGTQWTRAGVGKGAYLAVCCGWGDPMTGPGRGTAFVLQNEVSAAGGDQRLVLFRSANLDWNAVDERSIRIDADTQKLELKENGELTTDPNQTTKAELNQTIYSSYKTLQDEDGFQPVHMSSGFVNYLNTKIQKMLEGVDQAAGGDGDEEVSGQDGLFSKIDVNTTTTFGKTVTDLARCGENSR